MNATLRPLIDAYCCGVATDEQLDQLAALLRDDPDARRAFAEAMDLHAALRWRETSAARDHATFDRDPATTHHRIPTSPIEHRTSNIPYALAAALILAATVVAIYVFATNPQSEIRDPKSAPPPIASLVAATGEVWGEDAPVSPGDDLPPQLIESADGQLELLTRSGATVNLFGPTRLRLESSNALRLEHGRLTARATDGFTVSTQTFTVVDLGTEFAVATGPDGAGEVQVFDGSVKLIVGQASYILEAGAAYAIRSTGQIAELSAAPSADAWSGRTLATDRFDSHPDGGFGWSEAWTPLAGRVGRADGALVIAGDGTSHHAIKRTIDPGRTEPAEPVYFAATMRFDGPDTHRSIWLCVGARDDSVHARRSAIVGFRENRFNLSLADATGEFHLDVPAHEPEPGRSYRFVGRVEFDANGNRERLTVWLDPDDESDAPLGVVEADLAIDTLSDVVIETWELDPENSATIDDLSIGATWEATVRDGRNETSTH